MSITKIKNSVSSRVAAGAVGITMALALLGTAAPAQAAALTSAQIQSIVSLLQSFGADAQTIANVQASLMGQPTTGGNSGNAGMGTCTASFARSLTLGSTGADVMALQKFLNANGAMVSVSGAGSPGMETMYFGPATRAAVAKYQAAHAISPAVGYFGPITMAQVNAACAAGAGTGTGTGTTTGSTSGSTALSGVGRLANLTSYGAIESSLNEGDSSTPVVGVTADVKDGDVQLQRVDVTFDVSASGGSTALSKYVQSVDLYVNGSKVASMDPADGDYSSKVWTYRFTNLGNVVLKSGNTANIVVQVTPVSSIGSNEEGENITAEIASDGIRVVDATGISDTYGVTGNASETFNVNTATTGTLTVSPASDNPLDATVKVDADNTTEDITLLSMGLRAKNQDITINDFPVQLCSETSGVGGIVQSVSLEQGSNTVSQKTIASSTDKCATVVFNSINQSINKDDTQSYKVVVSVKKETGNYSNGEQLTASSTGSDTNWDVNDAQGNSVTPGGSATGGTMTLQTTGISVSLDSATETTSSGAGISGGTDVGTYTIKFTVTAGDDDLWIAKATTTRSTSPTAGDGIAWATTTTSDSAVTNTGTANFSVADTDNSDTASGYHISAGSSRTFTLSVALTATSTGFTGVRLTGITYSTDNAVTSADSVLTTGLDTFKTSNVQLRTY